MRHPALLLVVAGSIGSGGCTSFETVLRDFDRVAGVETDSEPLQLEYERNVQAWAATLDDPESVIPEEASENPAGYARRRLISMVSKARGDLLAIGRATHRLLLVAAIDSSVLNRIEAYEGISELLSDIGANPFEVVRSANIVDAGERTATVVEALRDLAPTARADGDLDASQRARYLAALDAVGSGPLASAADDRTLLRTLVDRAVDDPDRVARRATRAALAAAVTQAGSRMLFRALRESDARLREAAMWTIYRSSGSTSLPAILAWSCRPGSGGYQYPVTVRERRTLLRLCSQIRDQTLYATALDGAPRPIDFMYDTVVRDEDEGLRLVALECMARCLGRPVSFDRAWADQWWREFALREHITGPPE